MTSNITGSTTATIQSGQTTQTAIDLQTGPVIANMFLIHFARDSAFIEPPMRLVLEQVVNYAATHPDEKLLIVGHTDLTGSEEYNQSLSERRARSAYAFLTYGHSPEAALAEWNTLRMKRPRGELPSIKDSWGVREYQFMLQDLGYYIGSIDGKHGPMTDSGVRTFQKSHQLTEDGIVGQQTWETLIKVYLDQSQFSLSTEKFFSKDGEILKWLGCGEKDTVANKPVAWRPNRRTEFLFVKTDSFDFSVAKPDTFKLPEIGFVGDEWKFGLPDSEERCRFTVRDQAEAGKWLIQPTEKGTVTVRGTIKFKDEKPFANAKYELISPDGEYLDGEHPDSGKPALNHTDERGKFVYLNRYNRAGLYTFAIHEPSVVCPTESKIRTSGFTKGKTYFSTVNPTLENYATAKTNTEREQDSEEIEILVNPMPSTVSFINNGNENGLFKVINQVQIEGILNEYLVGFADLPFNVNHLLHSQKKSLFNIEVYVSNLPEYVRNIEVNLLSYSPGESESIIDSLIIKLKYKKGRFISSSPILAIPKVFKGKVSTDNFNVIAALAGGTIRAILLEKDHPLLDDYSAQVEVRGRVVYIFAQAFTDNEEWNSISIEAMRRRIGKANCIWAQAGIEIKERSIPNDMLFDQEGIFHEIQLFKDGHEDNQQSTELDWISCKTRWGSILSESSEKLFGIHPDCYEMCYPPCPPKSAYPTDVNVFCVLSITDRDIEGGDYVGYAFPPYYPLENPVVVLVIHDIENKPEDNVLAHELGHLLLSAWWPMNNHHYQLDGSKWPSFNIMSPIIYRDSECLDRIQLTTILTNFEYIDLSPQHAFRRLGKNYCGVFEPANKQ
jgi:hypothetical protein